METKEQQRYIGKLMTKGFEKAADSFSRFINRKMSLQQSSTILIDHDKASTFVSGERGSLMVLTTDIIGELSGRSYLILNDHARTAIYRAVSPQKELTTQIQEAMLLEIDNILSAAVIGQLANELNIEAYGDVPALQYVKVEDIQNVLRSSIKQEGPTSIILCNATFVLDDHDSIHTQFIWKLSTKVFDQIKHQPI